MEKKIYISWAIILIFILAFIIGTIFIFLITAPILKTPYWINWGGIILGILTGMIFLSLAFPFVIIIKDDVLKFIGFPWVFKIKLENIEKVIIKNYGFYFIPKNKKNYRWLYTMKEGNFKGFNFLGSASLKGWGAIIEFFKPLNPDRAINWDVLKEEQRKYIENILYN